MYCIVGLLCAAFCDEDEGGGEYDGVELEDVNAGLRKINQQKEMDA